ncbi:MAG: cytochrome c oxidase subunit I [Pseudomonadota bacterium]
MSVAVERPRPGGLVGWAATTDHKRIGVLTIAGTLVAFVASGVLALLIRTELAWPGNQVLSNDAYDQVFTMHGSGMIYLFLTPAALALGVYLVPLQLGASEIVAPRLTLLGTWLTFSGALVAFSGFLTRGGAGRDGWTAFYPLSDDAFTPGTGMDLWIVGTMLALAGPLVQAGTVLATILRRRAPGMTMLRIPVFSWSMLATCLMVVTSFPVALVGFALLLADRHGIGVYALDHGPAQYQHLFWFYAHPVVYVMFFPFVGAVAEVIATSARRPFFGYTATALSLLVFAALSMSVWAHHMFTTGQVQNEYFSLTSTALLVPAGAEYFGIVGTMVAGARLRLTAAAWFAVGFVLLFLLGGLSGIIVASPTLDYHVHDTMFVVAHFHYTLFAGSLFGFFAGFYFWFPKVTGALLREGLGKLQFALLFVGTNLAFFPLFLLGYDGMRRRIADYPGDAGFTSLNVVSTVGAGVVAVGILVFFVNVAVSLRRPVAAGDDPWGGQTLEWWTSSPPPPLNFDRALPPIASYAPLHDLRVEGEARRGP